jgi:hypothetical protein
MRRQIPALAYQPGGGPTAFAANGMSAGAPAGPSNGRCSSKAGLSMGLRETLAKESKRG